MSSLMYRRPEGIRIVDMAKYIDDYAYTDEIDVSKMFEYLYHLSICFAKRRRFFKRPLEYDAFGVWCASVLYRRYHSPRQYNEKTNPNGNVQRVKSIINLLKNTIFFLYKKYLNENKREVFTADVDTSNVAMDFAIKRMDRDNSTYISIEIQHYFTQISNDIRKIIKETPYANNKTLCNNLYISCVLSIIKSITLSNTSKEILANSCKTNEKREDLIDRLYKEEKESSLTLFHLEDSMRDFVQLTINKVLASIKDNMKYIIGSYATSDSLLKSVLKSAYDLEELNSYD